MKLTEIEDQYIDAYKTQSSILKKTFKEAKNCDFSLDSSELTHSLVRRMKTYYETQDEIKSFLNKRYSAPAADFFVESVLYFLKLSLETFNSKLEAHSERQIKKSKNSIRPDISIWKNEKVVAIIECKTQLGWSRSNWKEEFVKREEKLNSDFPDAKAFLLVMTGSNWGGLSEKNVLSKKYYCILKDKWPKEVEMEALLTNILTPVEGLFKEVLKIG